MPSLMPQLITRSMRSGLTPSCCKRGETLLRTQLAHSPPPAPAFGAPIGDAEPPAGTPAPPPPPLGAGEYPPPPPPEDPPGDQETGLPWNPPPPAGEPKPSKARDPP